MSLARLIAGHKEDLNTGRAVLRVDGYCSSFASPAGNRGIAHERSRQLKSYLIIQHGLREEHFITRNHTTSPASKKNIGVTVRLIMTPTPRKDEKTILANPSPATFYFSRIPDSGLLNTKSPQRPFHFAIKTNLLFDLATVANLSVELQITPKITTDIPVLFSPYKIKDTYQLRVLAFQPEIRYWLHDAFTGSFLGLHANIGWFNITLNDTRYQDMETVYGGGISYGYTYLFSPRWGMEFNMRGRVYAYSIRHLLQHPQGRTIQHLYPQLLGHHPAGNKSSIQILNPLHHATITILYLISIMVHFPLLLLLDP